MALLGDRGLYMGGKHLPGVGQVPVGGGVVLRHYQVSARAMRRGVKWALSQVTTDQ